jgi:hypothetical protein
MREPEEAERDDQDSGDWEPDISDGEFEDAETRAEEDEKYGEVERDDDGKRLDWGVPPLDDGLRQKENE